MKAAGIMTESRSPGQLSFVNTISGASPPSASGHYLFAPQGGTAVKLGTAYNKMSCTVAPTYTIAAAIKNVW